MFVSLKIILCIDSSGWVLVLEEKKATFKNLLLWRPSGQAGIMRNQMSLQFIQHEFIFQKKLKNILPPFFPVFAGSLILY